MVVNVLASTPTPGECGDESAALADYCVRQGPEWLAGLLVDPPGWLLGAVGVVAVGAIGLVAYTDAQLGLTQADYRQMLASAVLVGSCGAGALLFKQLGWFPYLVDVFGGWGLGAVVGLALAKRIRADEPRRGEDADHSEVTPET